jgi:hypothetical protein
MTAGGNTTSRTLWRGQQSKAGPPKKAVPPPGAAEADVAGAVKIRDRDVERLACKVGLEIVATPEALAEQANEISAALNDYVIWSRAFKARHRSSELRDWYDALGRWASDGIVLLGGDPNAGSPGWGDVAAVRNAASYLNRGWPAPPIESEAERAAFHHLHKLLAAARETPHVAGPSTYDATRDALVATLHYLDVLRILSRRAGANATEPPPGRKPDQCRKKLIRKLGAAFEALHGRAYVVSNRPIAALRDTIPYGPALDWSRALFSLAVRRAGAMARLAARRAAVPADTLPELHELARWANGTDTLAEAIRGRSRSRRAA